jgi:hypothetical protein
MGIRSRIPARAESVHEFSCGLEDRFWDGLELLMVDHRAGGIYLMGFAAEMILKLACCRIDGMRPNDRISVWLGTVRSWAKRNLPGVDPEHFHSIFFWTQAYKFKRAMAGASNPPLIAELDRRMSRLHENWLVDMRYVDDRSLPAEADEVYDDVAWIRDQYLQGLL